MVKFDIQDAYKLIPGDPQQWGLFGFKWLGKFFFDITRVFGSKAAPEEFDALPETLVNIACTLSSTPKSISPRKFGYHPGYPVRLRQYDLEYFQREGRVL